MGARRILVTLGVALATVLFVALGAAPASAHAYLDSSSPADGASLVAAPRVIELRFTEHVILEATEITITGPHEHRLAPTGLTLVESDKDQEAPATVIATMPALGVGAYHLSWRTLSSDDLHVASGSLAFGVQSTVLPAGASEPSPDPTDSLGRWLVLAGFALTLGSLTVTRLLGQAPESDWRATAYRKTSRLGRRGAGLAALAALVLAVVDLTRFGATALQGAYAARWGLREVLLVALVLALPRAATPSWPHGGGWQGARSRPRVAEGSRVGPLSVRRASPPALAALITLLTVLMGHSAGRGGSTLVIASAVHLGAGLTWAGGVALLAVLAARVPRSDRPHLLALLRSFRMPATVCVAAVVVSGVYLASEVVASVDALLVTDYGRLLLLKLAVALTVGLVALGTTRRLHSPRRVNDSPVGDTACDPRSSPSTQRVVAEAATLMAVVALGALLASGQPALGPQLVEAQEASTISDQAVADLQQTLVLRPNRPGLTVALVDVHDTRRPSPGPVTGVTVRLRDDAGRSTPSAAADVAASRQPATAPVEATPVSPNRWSAGLMLQAPGAVSIDVVVHRRSLPDVTSTVPWVVGGSGSATSVTLVSRAPIGAALKGASLVLLLAATGASLRFVRLRQRRVRAPGAIHSPAPAGRSGPPEKQSAQSLVPAMTPESGPITDLAADVNARGRVS